MGDARVVWMLAMLCSVIANTSADSEGKTFVYRRSTGTLGHIGTPDPTMMRPQDFLPNFGGVAEEAPAEGKHMTDRTAEEMIRSIFPGAVDTRKLQRSGPRLT